jgi:hypothetical protein
MAHLEVNDAILAFEEASQKRPPAGWTYEPDFPTVDMQAFLTWLQTDRVARRQLRKVTKLLKKVYLEADNLRIPFDRYMKELPRRRPYWNLVLEQKLNWLNAQATAHGLEPEMIQWQLLDAR